MLLTDILYCDMRPQIRNTRLRVDVIARKRLVNRFQQQRIRKQQSRYCRAVTVETVTCGHYYVCPCFLFVSLIERVGETSDRYCANKEATIHGLDK
jgi:hypothetical protein